MFSFFNGREEKMITLTSISKHCQRKWSPNLGSGRPRHSPNAFFSPSGYWPLGSVVCNLWVTFDVLCSSSSIYHMCVISIGRYIGIRNPLHAHQAQSYVSRKTVLLKIMMVWLLAALLTSPITILAIIDQQNIQPKPRTCLINNPYFIIIGKHFN